MVFWIQMRVNVVEIWHFGRNIRGWTMMSSIARTLDKSRIAYQMGNMLDACSDRSSIWSACLPLSRRTTSLIWDWTTVLLMKQKKLTIFAKLLFCGSLFRLVMYLKLSAWIPCSDHSNSAREPKFLCVRIVICWWSDRITNLSPTNNWNWKDLSQTIVNTITDINWDNSLTLR